MHATISPHFGHKHQYVCTDTAHLVSQNEQLKGTCEERLELIQRLKATADVRLKVIEVLDSEVQRLSGRNRS
jgi:endonuclease IV